jgi:hypothetical protein
MCQVLPSHLVIGVGATLAVAVVGLVVAAMIARMLTRHAVRLVHGFVLLVVVGGGSSALRFGGLSLGRSPTQLLRSSEASLCGPTSSLNDGIRPLRSASYGAVRSSPSA